MALVRHDSKEVQFKIVYCGPPQGGKTTNLSYIHRRLDDHHRGDLVSVATQHCRTIHFDFLPVYLPEISGYRTKFQIYTIPGQTVLQQARERVLAGVDGLVFVADSSPDAKERNLEAFRECRDALHANGLSFDSIPTAFQFNKRDVRDAIAPDLLDEWFALETPSFLSCALTGYQVFATLDFVTKRVLKGFHGSIVQKNESEEVSPSRETIPVEAIP